MKVTHEQYQAIYKKFVVEPEPDDKLNSTGICTNCPLEFGACNRRASFMKGIINATVNLNSDVVKNARKAGKTPNCGVDIRKPQDSSFLLK